MRRRISYANVAATLALVFSMSGGALAANHYLINSSKQINPKLLKKLKGNRGKTGATGPQGKEGASGKEGKEGKEGLQGKGLPAFLASGESEQGLYAVWGVGGGYLGTSLEFKIPLKAALDDEHVFLLSEKTTHAPQCTGTAAAPTAASGDLCVYVTSHGGTTGGTIFPESTGLGSGTDTNGFGLFFIGEGTAGDDNYGTWAVTG